MEAKIYLPLCEQYHSLAKNFYEQYLHTSGLLLPESPDWLEDPLRAQRQFESQIGRLQSAICVVIFEALSVEALVNYFGAVTLGDDVFYKKYERYSTVKN